MPPVVRHGSLHSFAWQGIVCCHLCDVISNHVKMRDDRPHRHSILPHTCRIQTWVIGVGLDVACNKFVVVHCTLSIRFPDAFTYGTRGNTTKNCSLFALPGQARAPTLSEPCWGWRDTPYKEGIRPGMLLRSPGSTPATGSMKQQESGSFTGPLFRLRFGVSSPMHRAEKLSMSCIAAAGRLKGVCVVTNAAYARADECFVLCGRHHADPAGVATRQLLRWLLDQYRRRDDWLMVHRPPLRAARRLPLERGALLHLLRSGGHCGGTALPGRRY